MLLGSDRRSIIGLTLALIGSVSVAPRVSATTWKPAHVVVVIEENHTREQVLPKTLPNLAAALTAKGYSFAGFSEDIPEAGSLLKSSPKGYARKHNPWSNWQSDADGSNLLKPSVNRSFDSFPRTPEKFSTDLLTVAFVVPNIYNDEHGRAQDKDTLLLKRSNDWLQTYIEPFARWAKDNDSLLIVTWDEGYSKDNSIPLILYGAGVKKGRYNQKVTDYHVLRLIEDLYGLDLIGESAKVDPIRDVIP